MIDVLAKAEPWLNLCGPCDAGYPTACSCQPGDPRVIILELVREVERLRQETR